VVGTLGMALPERLVGDLKGASNIISISGRQPRTRRRVPVRRVSAGGTGGTAQHDGNNACATSRRATSRRSSRSKRWKASCRCASSACCCAPMRAARDAQRGGLGLQREIRVLGGRGALSVLSDKNLIPPYGVRGGGTGAPNRFTVRRDGGEIEPSPQPGKVTASRCAPATWCRAHARRRRLRRSRSRAIRSAVLRDVRFGMSRARRARADVRRRAERTIDVDDGCAPRVAGTACARERVVLRATRRGSADGDAMRGRLVLDIWRRRRRALGVGDGELVDLPRDDGPSLLAWVAIVCDVAPDDVPSARRELRDSHRASRIDVRRVPDRRR
jgi:N-methylhydantoinase B